MEHSNRTIGHLVDLYDGFVESMQNALLSTITDPKIGRSIAFTSTLRKRTLPIRTRTLSIIEAFVSLNEESDTHEELEALADQIKRFIDQDMFELQQVMMRFSLRANLIRQTDGVSMRNAVINVREKLFEDDRLFRLNNLGRATERIQLIPLRIRHV